MNTKTIVGMLVAAIIMFMWQFLSWSMLNVHAAEFGHSPDQDKILSFLGDNLEEGTYFLPHAPPGSSMEDAQKFMEPYMNKPWAKVQYNKSFDDNMGMNMFRGFTANLLAAFLLIWLLMKIPNNNFVTTLLASLGVGIIAFINFPYINSIWFEGNSLGYLVDTLLQWGVVGAWLGWWLNRGNS